VGVRSLVRVGSSSGGKREEEAWVTSGLWFLPPFWAPLTPEVLVLDFLEVDIIFVVDVFDVDFVLAFLILVLDFVVFFVLTDFSCSSDEDEELDILLVLVPLDFVVVVVVAFFVISASPACNIFESLEIFLFLDDGVDSFPLANKAVNEWHGDRIEFPRPLENVSAELER